MKNYSKLLALGLTLGLGACASIIEGESDRVELKTQQNIPAQCQLSNGRGTYTINAPGSAEIKKSKTDLDINCHGADGSNAKKVVQSDMETWFIGNLVFGGIIGGGVDAATGSMWEYPKEISVDMTPIAQPVSQQYYTPAEPQQSYAPATLVPEAATAPATIAPAAPYAQPQQYAPTVQPQAQAAQPTYYAPAQVPAIAPAN